MIIHQFSRIGRLAMVGGGSAIGRDVLPFCTTASLERNRIAGLNSVGLRRAGPSKSSFGRVAAFHLPWQCWPVSFQPSPYSMGSRLWRIHGAASVSGLLPGVAATTTTSADALRPCIDATAGVVRQKLAPSTLRHQLQAKAEKITEQV